MAFLRKRDTPTECAICHRKDAKYRKGMANPYCDRCAAMVEKFRMNGGGPPRNTQPWESYMHRHNYNPAGVTIKRRRT